MCRSTRETLAVPRLPQLLAFPGLRKVLPGGSAHCQRGRASQTRGGSHRSCDRERHQTPAPPFRQLNLRMTRASAAPPLQPYPCDRIATGPRSQHSAMGFRPESGQRAIGHPTAMASRDCRRAAHPCSCAGPVLRPETSRAPNELRRLNRNGPAPSNCLSSACRKRFGP